MSKLTYKKYCA